MDTVKVDIFVQYIFSRRAIDARKYDAHDNVSVEKRLESNNCHILHFLEKHRI